MHSPRPNSKLLTDKIIKESRLIYIKHFRERCKSLERLVELQFGWGDGS